MTTISILLISPLFGNLLTGLLEGESGTDYPLIIQIFHWILCTAFIAGVLLIIFGK